MTPEEKALVDYRLERAHEALDEAKLLFEAGHLYTYVNRPKGDYSDLVRFHAKQVKDWLPSMTLVRPGSGSGVTTLPAASRSLRSGQASSNVVCVARHRPELAEGSLILAG